ncbi:DUF1402 family protein [Chelativorans sp. M5D2P16]|uniref:DUF1402 family protein n=1 Tax=Chelativorans sp. M5D2P16 TaxID=3095678 RepID=UPI002ACA8B44|nr:DUF1402 family protein [Chelativorans sp. M5D2P16]MDZ5697399.1 DUF1402 family protein [Chelativorans sp. M5D2P16]
MALRHCMVLGFSLSVAAFSAEALELVAAGNHGAEQPPVPGASSRRTSAGGTTFDAKYAKIYGLLESDAALRTKIRKAAALFGIAPIHVIGAIVGEHTYNVDAYDHLQTYYVKAVSYLESSFSFSHGGESLASFLERPQFDLCDEEAGSHEVWSCREAVWDKAFRGRTVEGKRFPDDRFSAVFFQPFYAGQTFGIGQLNPLTALQVTDMVHEVTGLEKLDYGDAQQVYRTIMNPDITLYYVAATLKKAIDAYADIAGFDISSNPGLTATLYNVGNPETRAARLATENRLRRKQGRAPKLPKVNYYGWLVNDKQEELEALLADS